MIGNNFESVFCFFIPINDVRYLANGYFSISNIVPILDCTLAPSFYVILFKNIIVFDSNDASLHHPISNGDLIYLSIYNSTF